MYIVTKAVMMQQAGENRRLTKSESKALKRNIKNGSFKASKVDLDKISSYMTNGHSMCKRESKNDLK
ncbi:MAG: hypothetical protein IJB82_03320 [Bacilli bacterium]|nr:hypothetical protein [Bacilli bacterium]